MRKVWKVKAWFTSKYHDTLSFIEADSRENALEIAKADLADSERTYLKFTVIRDKKRELPEYDYLFKGE